jgi:ribose transport system ATP-binding protein
VDRATTSIDRTSGGPSAAPALILYNLSKTFGGQRALDQAALDVREGEVHGLLGQNGSGKSTLIKILAGFHAPDPGSSLSLAGEIVSLPLAPGAFRRYRISFVHQHLGLIPSLSVVENLLINRLATEAHWAISWPQERAEVAALLRRYDIDIDPRVDVMSLTPVERALLAIVRAVREIDETATTGIGKGILILDEPTPFLPKRDVDRLFAVVRAIVAGGASVIFVSHDVDEVMEITNRATILRDGRVVGTLVTPTSSKSAFIEMIIGRKLNAYGRGMTQDRKTGPAIRIERLVGGGVTDFSADLRSGEVLGLTGLIGSGYDEVPYLVYGAKPAAAGTIDLGTGSRPLANASPSRSIAAGVVLVPADRPNAAVINQLPVVDNVTMPVLDNPFRRWKLDRRGMAARASELSRRFEVVPNRPALPVSALSGGNAQKVVLAKWLQRAPKLLLLDEPTQGVDVGARQTVYRHVAQAAAAGSSVLCASSDYEQLELICDRVLIFAQGRVIAELAGGELTKAAIAQQCYLGSAQAISEDIL